VKAAIVKLVENTGVFFLEVPYLIYDLQSEMSLDVREVLGNHCCGRNTGHFIIFSVITNIYNKKTKGPTLMELFTATGKLKKFF
jgi:hypothetical protein